jgi:predicted dienelactone hydrolase
MKRTFLPTLMLLIATVAFAQYPIGHRSITYQDPARSNRSVPIEVYYPGISTGDDVNFAAGQFPLIVFGHGFVMGYDAYLFWKDNLVPEGYIIAFPTTEGSASPNHTDFGADLAFLINKIKSENTNGASPFYQTLSATSAVMGHSMGGGSSFLACENNTIPTCMVTFAAANTTPSSITAAANVTIPALVMSANNDCVAPPASHQTLMYNALASPCKVFIGVVNGMHCYFGDYNALCTTGESFCNPVPDIARADQEAVALDFTLLFLNYYLKNDPTAWPEFTDSLNTSNRITHQISCPSVGMSEQPSLLEMAIFPNPSENIVNIIFPSEISGELNATIYSIDGCIVMKKAISLSSASSIQIDISTFKSGVYFLECERAGQVCHKKMTIL